MAESYEHSDSGNWNISSNYVEEISRLLREANQYKEIAKYGFSDIISELNTKESDKTLLRKKGLEKYIYKLKDVIMYCWFAMRTSSNKTKFLDYHKDLEYIEKNWLIHIITKIPQGYKNKSIINEPIFDFIFEKIEKIDREIREPMKEADLIFQHKETFDPNEFKKSVEARFIDGG